MTSIDFCISKTVWISCSTSLYWWTSRLPTLAFIPTVNVFWPVLVSATAHESFCWCAWGHFHWRSWHVQTIKPIARTFFINVLVVECILHGTMYFMCHCIYNDTLHISKKKNICKCTEQVYALHSIITFNNALILNLLFRRKLMANI